MQGTRRGIGSALNLPTGRYQLRCADPFALRKMGHTNCRTRAQANYPRAQAERNSSGLKGVPGPAQRKGNRARTNKRTADTDGDTRRKAAFW